MDHKKEQNLEARQGDSTELSIYASQILSVAICAKSETELKYMLDTALQSCTYGG